MKIGLFGGSFNPVHKGHIKIAKEAIEALNLTKLIFIPCQKNPFKKNNSYVSGEDRFKMIEMVLEEKMEVSNFEINRKGLSYSIDTIKYFKNKYKDNQIFFIIGSDNLAKLSKWKDIDQILTLSQFAVFKRDKDSKINKSNIKKFNCILINNKVYPESSTEFLKGKFEYVDDRVLKYIGEKKLYFDLILKNILTEKRYIHSIHARDFAIELAKSNNFNIEKAAFAALVHDIAKHIANDNKEEARKIIEKYEPKNKNIEDYKLHQEVGYIILKHIFNVEEDICNAVRIHTSLDMNLTKLDKIVYLADKLCKGRKYPGIQKVREISLKNIDEGLKFVVQNTVKFNKDKGIVFTKEQEKIYEKWSK